MSYIREYVYYKKRIQKLSVLQIDTVVTSAFLYCLVLKKKSYEKKSNIKVKHKT